MTTKYAKAKDTAFQWRSEYRKVKEENRSLRRVMTAAVEFINVTDDPEHLLMNATTARARLKSELRAVILAAEGV